MKQSSFVLVQDANDCVLFLRRGPTDPWMPGRWNFPGGGRNGAESHTQTAVRELNEEAGISAPPNRLSYLGKFKTGRIYTVHLYGLRLRTRPNVFSRDGEHDAFVWASLTDPPRPLVPWMERLVP